VRLLLSVCTGVMHQVKKLCEPDVIDLSAKKSESTTSAAAAAAVTDAVPAAAGADAASLSLTSVDKHQANTAVPSAATGIADGRRQASTVTSSGSSPRM